MSFKNSSRPFVTLCTLIIVLVMTSFSPPKNKRKLTDGMLAPSFSIKDVYGKTVSLDSLKGKKILISFHRYAGCPVCNVRFHNLEMEADYFKANNIVNIAMRRKNSLSLIPIN